MKARLSEEISKQLGMKPEEVFRLSDFSKEEFLAMMTKGVKGYSKAGGTCRHITSSSFPGGGDSFARQLSMFFPGLSLYGRCGHDDC